MGAGCGVGGAIGKQARWALGLVIRNTWPVGRIFTVGLQCSTTVVPIVGTKPFGLNWPQEAGACLGRRTFPLHVGGGVGVSVVFGGHGLRITGGRGD